MIRNVIFDMGNVLLDWDPKTRLSQMGFSEIHQKVLYEEIFRTIEWSMLDAGKIEVDEAVRKMCERLAFHVKCGFYPFTEEEIPQLVKEVKYVMDHPKDLVRPEKETQFLPQALKDAGYHCYLLTNASVLFRDYQSEIPAFLAMEGIFVSAEHRMLKPDREIYEAMLSEFALKAEESVFIDDMPINVAGAIFCGMEGVVYKADVGRLLTDLGRLGVTINLRRTK